MIMFAIYAMTIANMITAVYVLRRYVARNAVLQLCFSITWTLHYVVGNILVLLSTDYTYTLAPFDDFLIGYLLSMVAGQYFLWVYLYLLDSSTKSVGVYRPIRESALPQLLLFLAVSIGFALILIFAIGVSNYFSPELAQYRTRLGDYAPGVGVFYYLATFLIPATLLIGNYSTSHVRMRNTVIAMIALLIAGIVFVPLGGRGRVVNIILLLVLAYMFARPNFQLSKFFSKKVLALIVGVFAVSYVWGVLRESADAQLPTDPWHVIWSLSVDTTRLPFQAFIFERYPVTGVYHGTHYLESVLGPFYEFLSSEPVGLIRQYSSRWYAETVGYADLPSAVSPSFIGEIFINFGVLGVVFAPFAFFAVMRVIRSLGREDSALSLAIIVYFFQFNLFHGGLYALFDTLVMTVPVLLACNFFTERRPVAPRGVRTAPAFRGITTR